MYRQRGGKLPIDIQRLVNLRKWWHMPEWPQTEASITETHIRVPNARITNFVGVGFPPPIIEVSFQYDANGSQCEGKFSVAFVDMEWATMAMQNAVGQKVRVQFDPKDPKDCVPVEDEWLGFKVWSVG
jgi:hypothetical protein